MWRILAGPAILIFLASVRAQENVPLKPGPGLETVEAYCEWPKASSPLQHWSVAS